MNKSDDCLHEEEKDERQDSSNNNKEDIHEEKNEPIYVLNSPRVPQPIAATLHSSDFVSPWIETSEPSVSLDMSDYGFGGNVNDVNELSSDKLPSVQIDTRPNSEAFNSSSEDNTYTYTYTTATYRGTGSIIDSSNVFRRFPLRGKVDSSRRESNSESADGMNIILTSLVDEKAREFTLMLPHGEPPKDSICCILI